MAAAQLVTLDPGIFTIEALFTPQECAVLIGRAEGIGFEAASVRTADGPKMMTGIRNNDRVNLHDEALAAEMFSRLADLLPVLDGTNAVGVDPELRFYRYEPGQIFRRHRDGVATNDRGQTSKLSYLIYLNETDGGATVFREPIKSGGTKAAELKVQPTTGSALLFRHERWHEGSPVESGRKYVLRSDVFYA